MQELFGGVRGKRGPKVWKYSMDDVAEASGRSPRGVREDIRNGRLDILNLGKVAEYIVRHKLEVKDVHIEHREAHTVSEICGTQGKKAS